MKLVGSHQIKSKWKQLNQKLISQQPERRKTISQVKGEGFTPDIESVASASSSRVWRICSGGETETENSSKPSNTIEMEATE